MSRRPGIPGLECGGRRVEFARYGEGGVALMLIEPNGEPYCVASVNLAPYGSRPLAADEIWLKTWGGQQLVPKALELAGILTLTDEVMVGDGSHPSAIAQLGKLTETALTVLRAQEG